jgi:hypothetical protein
MELHVELPIIEKSPMEALFWTELVPETFEVWTTPQTKPLQPSKWLRNAEYESIVSILMSCQPNIGAQFFLV